MFLVTRQCSAFICLFVNQGSCRDLPIILNLLYFLSHNMHLFPKSQLLAFGGGRGGCILSMEISNSSLCHTSLYGRKQKIMLYLLYKRLPGCWLWILSLAETYAAEAIMDSAEVSALVPGAWLHCISKGKLSHRR